ncbi:phage replisome organizer N-terminal domain-containing protein [Enterococcus sp. N249-2]
MAYKNNPKAKRYYWLQLKTDFFDQKEIKLLRKIAGGDTFTIIYLKMLLASLKDNGKLYFEAIGDDFAEEIALLIDEEVENVAVTVKFLEAKKLIEIVENDEYFLNKVPGMVGSESYSAERMRNMRAREKNKELQSDDETSQSDSVVTKSREEKSREEIELEKSHSYRDIQVFYENNGFGTLSSKTREDFIYWIEDFRKAGCTEEDAIKLIIHAMEKSIDNNVRKYAYINGILKDWEQKKVLNVDQVKAMDKQRKTGKAANERVWIKSGDDF